MPNWRRLHGGFAIARSVNRSTGVELWYADDLALGDDGTAPNKAAIFASFGLPPRGAPSVDPDLPGAILIEHRLVEPAVVIGTTARAKVACIYDSAVRFRLDTRFRQSVDLLEPLKFNVPLIALRSSTSGDWVQRRDEADKVKRGQWRRRITVRVTGDIGAAIAAIEQNIGLLYRLNGNGHSSTSGTYYTLDGFGIVEHNVNDFDITYAFYSNCRVRAVLSGSGFGQHVALPALGNLDEYAPDEGNLTISVRTATQIYTNGATLPGGIG